MYITVSSEKQLQFDCGWSVIVTRGGAGGY